MNMTKSNPAVMKNRVESRVPVRWPSRCHASMVREWM